MGEQAIRLEIVVLSQPPRDSRFVGLLSTVVGDAGDRARFDLEGEGEGRGVRKEGECISISIIGKRGDEKEGLTERRRG